MANTLGSNMVKARGLTAIWEARITIFLYIFGVYWARPSRIDPFLGTKQPLVLLVVITRSMVVII
jgi:hypothetical protein